MAHEQPQIVVVSEKTKTQKRKNFSLLCEEEEDDEDLAEISTNDVIINELKMYLTLKGSITEYTCPLQFYKLISDKLPFMAKIAFMLFCITASSVPSECVFSSAGDLISNKGPDLDLN